MITFQFTYIYIYVCNIRQKKKDIGKTERIIFFQGETK